MYVCMYDHAQLFTCVCVAAAVPVCVFLGGRSVSLLLCRRCPAANLSTQFIQCGEYRPAVKVSTCKQPPPPIIGSVIGISCNALKNKLAPLLEASNTICSWEQSSDVSCQHGLVVQAHPYLHNAGL